MKTHIKPENRSWPRENSKNTKQEGLILNVKGRSDLFPLQSLLRSALCALCVLLRQFHFGIRVKNLFLLPALIAVLNLLPSGRVTAQSFTTLHSFTYYDGANPVSGLTLSGNTLYGTSEFGGSLGYGTAFAVNTDGTSFANLHHFQREHYRVFNCFSQEGCFGRCDQFGGGGVCYSGIPNYCECNGYSDGNYPYAGLITNSSGNTLYGTAVQGGSWDAGTVFAINTNGTGFTNLHSFTGGYAGAHPYAALILTNNTLYGTTSAGGFGGGGGGGTVFKVNTDGTGFTTLYRFTGILPYPGPYTNSDGAYPVAGLIVSGNTLYGTANGGGSSGNGTVFAVNTDGTGFTNLHSFTAYSGCDPNCTNSDGVNPYAGLILTNNTLYGTANGGGSSGVGTVFKVNTDGTGFTNLHSFTAISTNSSGVYTNGDGYFPQAGLILSGNTLYGTAGQGGSSGAGTAFALNTDGTGFTNLYSFTAAPFGTNSDGAYPQAGLILSGNTLYGTAQSGGSSGNGTVFSLSFRPQLTITPSGTNVILSWPISYAGFSYAGYILQETANLSSPDAWVVSDAFPPVIVNGQIRLTGPMRGPQRYYRLRKF